MALLIQGTWRNNDYVSIFRLVNTLFFYKMGTEVVYIYIG